MQGCQMVCLQNKIQNFGTLGKALELKIFVYFTANLVYFVVICSVVWPFPTFWFCLVFCLYFGIFYQGKSGNPLLMVNAIQQLA
jgi:fatty acid desaturase